MVRWRRAAHDMPADTRTVEGIIELTKRLLSRANNHRVYVETHRFILNHQMQAIVIDQPVINTVNHVDTATAKRGPPKRK